MGWSTAFQHELSRSNPRRRYVLDSIGAISYVPGSSSVWLSTHDEGAFHLPIIARDGHSYRAGSMVPGEWSTTMSELTIRLTKGWNYGLSGAARGQLYQLRMGFQGWAWGDFQPLFTGRVVGIRRGTAGDWFVDLRSAAGLLVSRSTQVGTQTALFYDLPQSATTLATAITPTSTTFQVVDATGAAAETGGRYLVEITPDPPSSGSSDPYFLECTALSGTKFTISGPVFGASQLAAKGPVGTTLGNAARVFAYVKDHPVDVAKKLITSTGLGTNGDYDTLPASWGIGLPWSVLNLDDMDTTKNAINSGASAVTSAWRVYASDPQDDALGWLQNTVLGPAGLFLTEAEGQLTVRLGTNSNGQQTDVQWIDDSEIVSLDHEEWDPQATVEYSRMAATAPNLFSTTAEYLASLPASFERQVVLPFLDTSQVAWVQNILARCVGWSCRLPEAITLVVLGHKRANLAPGSGLGITSKRLESRSPFPDDLWMVTSCEPDWWGTTTTIRASRIPHAENTP